MLEDDLPTRSVNGLAASDIFYSNLKYEVFFYVEDEDQENLYELILKKIVPDLNFDRIKIFPLGGKPMVLTHAEKNSNSLANEKQIYLVDKDFDDLLGVMKTTDKRIIYLDRHCIENYFIEEDAIINFIVQSHPKEKKTDIKTKLNFSSFEKDTFTQLATLFSLFLCVQKLELELANCKTKPEKYTSKKCWMIDPVKVTSYYGDMEKIALDKNITISEKERNFGVTVAKKNIHQIVSGKFFMALLLHYLKHHYSIAGTTQYSFIYRIAEYCSLQSMQPISSKILEIIHE